MIEIDAGLQTVAADGRQASEWLRSFRGLRRDFVAQRFLNEMRQIVTFLACQSGGLGKEGIIKLDHCLHTHGYSVK